MFASQIDNHDNTSSLVDNGSEAEFLNESFAHEKKIEMIELDEKDRVELILGDGTPSQILEAGKYSAVNSSNNVVMVQAPSGASHIVKLNEGTCT